MKSLICALLLFSLPLAACGTVPPAPTSTPVPSATFTPVPVPTSTPTPEPTPFVDEHDLEPNFVQETDTEFMGVRIHASLITDKSLDPSVKEVTVTDKIYAEFIARTFFKVWWKKAEAPHEGTATEEDFKAFMALWAKAQETNDPEDWKKVQIHDIWANDLDDGNGYKQEPYTIWPMYFGSNAPEGVEAIRSFAIALVRTSKVKNINKFISKYGGDQGMGINLDNDGILYFYLGLSKETYSGPPTAGQMSAISQYLNKNSNFASATSMRIDFPLQELLLKGLEQHP